MLKRTLKQLFSLFGFEIRRFPANSSEKRLSLAGALNHLRKQGWYPKTVIDVGAAFGDWSREASQIFSKAHYLLIDPLKEYGPALKKVLQNLDSADYIPVALIEGEEKKARINVHKDLVGSSLLKETEGAHVDGSERQVPAQKLDSIVNQSELQKPFLLKIDVQGAELKVLAGAEETINNTDVIILELSLFQSMKEGPQFYEVVAFLKKKGFVVYDIVGLSYRPYDNSLSQTDLVFVKEKSALRHFHGYAKPEQRKKQDRRFQNKQRPRLQL